MSFKLCENRTNNIFIYASVEKRQKSM